MDGLTSTETAAVGAGAERSRSGRARRLGRAALPRGQMRMDAVHRLRRSAGITE